MALTKDQILRAWKDDQFAASLPEEDRRTLPQRPTTADGAELTDEQLEQAAGGTSPVVASYIGTAAITGSAVALFD